jgi:hypothetical protein
MQTRLIPMSVLAVAMMTGKAPADSAIAEMICAPRAEILARLGQASVAGTGLASFGGGSSVSANHGQNICTGLRDIRRNR